MKEINHVQHSLYKICKNNKKQLLITQLALTATIKIKKENNQAQAHQRK